MEFIPAATIFPQLPAGLPAAFFYQRQSRGKTVRICAVGDISFSGKVGESFQASEAIESLAEITPVLFSSDITFGNLECVLSSDASQQPMFVAPVEAVDILRAAGFSVLHLANNHIYDLGREGFFTTLRAVESAGILALGAGWTAEKAKQMRRTDRNGIRIGWLGCGRTSIKQNEAGPHYWEFNEIELLSAISRVREEVDILILSLHKGFMCLDYPSPEDRVIIKRLAAAGADIILMHHAHVLQGVEILPHDKICCYCLGNFLFDSREGYVTQHIMQEEQNSGAIFLFDVDTFGIVRAIAIPTLIIDRRSVGWALNQNGMGVLSRLKRTSIQLTENYGSQFVQQRIQRNAVHAGRVLLYHLLNGNFKTFGNILTQIKFKHLLLFLRFVFEKITKLLQRE